MLQTITITPKWQIYIPNAAREILGLTKPVKAKLEVKEAKIIITPQKSALLELAGKYRHLYEKKKINLNRVRDYIDYANW